MTQEYGFDFTGTYAIATRFDQIDRFASDDPVHSVGVDDGDVSGAIPAVFGEYLGGLFRQVEIAAEQCGPLNLQLANGFPVMRGRAAILGQQAGLHPRQGVTDPTCAPLSVGTRGQRDDSLRGAVAFDRGMPGERA